MQVAGTVPLGLIAAVLTLVTVAQLTENQALSLGAAGGAAIGVTAVTSRQAMRTAVASGHTRTIIAIGIGIFAAAVGAMLAWAVILSPMPASAPPDDTAGYWDLPTGSRIAYRHTPADAQAGDTPVILLHGGPGSPDADAAEVAAAVAAGGFDVYYYHQLGAGRSSRLDGVEGYTVARHVADLEAIRVAIGAERVILVGASWGGQLAMSYVAAHPTRIERVVVSSPNSIWAPAFADNARLTPGGQDDQGAVIGNHTRFLIPHVLMGIVGPGAANAVVPDTQADGAFEGMVSDLDMWAGCPGRTAPDGSTEDAAGGGFGFWVNAVTTRDSRTVDDPRPALRQADVPLLVLRAECDYLAWEVTREYRDVIPGALLVPINDAGHVVWDDQPDLYAALVTGFLREEELPLQPYAGDTDPWGPER